MQSDPFEALNPEQRVAVEHGTAAGPAVAGPLLVIAGAGSGKTNTLACRVARLVLAGVEPGRILLLTFSRRAAVEMTRRVQRITAAALGTRHAPLSWSGTFHAMGARLLRYYAPQVGLDPSFTILDREDAADLMNLVRHDLGLSSKTSRFPLKGTCLAVYSRAVNAEAALEAVLNENFPWCAEWQDELKTLFAAYVDAKQRQNTLDYDDLLLCWAQMMTEPDLAADVAARFDHVLVDEYQDTNRLQASILLRLKPDGFGLTVVGDDAQSIYSFRAATVRNILDFPNLFRPPARVVTLEHNYRSTQPILDAGNAVIALARERFTKNLRSQRASQQRPLLIAVRDEAEQALCVVARLLAAREAGIPLKGQAVLFRASHHAAQLEIELARRNIPFVKYGGLKFLAAAHVKDVISVLRLAENRRDRVAGFRVLQLLPGVGPATAAKIFDCIDAAPALADGLAAARPPTACAECWPALVQLFAELRAKTWPAEFQLVRDWYAPHLQRIHEDAQARAQDLQQLEEIARGCVSREEFLTELTLDPPDATSDWASDPLLDEDYLILSTIHAAKGQEWRSVHILNVVDGCIPSDMATGTPEELEEERRLLYVAMTRARDDLALLMPQRFFTHQQHRMGDRHVYAARSRFIPDSLLRLFESRTWPGAASRAARERTAADLRKVDLGARLRAMWR